MKRLSRERRERLNRERRKITRLAVRNRTRRRNRTPSRRLRSGCARRLRAPEVFNLGEARRGALLSFIDQLRSEAGVRRRPVVIDFSRTVHMVADGTLLFAAELSRVNELTAPARLVTAHVPPKHRVVAQVLQHVGIAKMLGIRTASRIRADNVKYWHIGSGSGVSGEQIGAAMAGYEECFSEDSGDTVVQQLYRGLSEAVTNCHQHAYVGSRNDGLLDLKKWWMFSQRKDGELSVLLCDLGIGIPTSLKDHADLQIRARVTTFLKSVFRPETDGSLIQAAVAIGKTRTGESHRGYGLADIRSVIDQLGGTLTILSNAGAYTYKAGEHEDGEISDFPLSIRGTLVQWRIPIPKAVT